MKTLEIKLPDVSVERLKKYRVKLNKENKKYGQKPQTLEEVIEYIVDLYLDNGYDVV